MLTTWKRNSPKLSERFEAERFDSASAIFISGPDDLQQLQPALVRAIDTELGVGALASKVCPVLLADHTVAIFALASHVGADQADALSQRILESGYILAVPERYILPAPMLLSIVRRQFNVSGVSEYPAVPARQLQTGLAQAFQDMVAWGVANQASDLHINIFSAEAESEVRFTVAGRYLSPERFSRIPTRTLSDMLAVAWMEVRGGNGAVFDPRIEQQGRLHKTIDGRPVLLRWASLPADRGPSVCLRILSRATVPHDQTLEKLGYLPHQVAAIEQALKTSGGSIVFAGNVGSGKSTSLATLIARLPEARKVITIEDPVEYLIPNAVQNTVSRQLDDASHGAWAAKLRTLKRSAMSDVLLGEIRDLETGRAFMDLAGSGVNVYTTVHAPAAVAIGERLASDFIGVSRDFLATPGVLKLLVYQALLPRLCANCSLDFHSADAEWQAVVSLAYKGATNGLRMRNPDGCPQCVNVQLPQQNGYAGRTVAAEYIQPAHRPEFLLSLRRADGLQFLLGQKAKGFDPSGRPERQQSALHCAMYKSLSGQIDPSDIEQAFRPFAASVELERRCRRTAYSVPRRFSRNTRRRP